MPFERPTLSTIKTRILNDITSRLTGGATLLRKALLRILGIALAGAIHTLYGYLDYLAKQVLPDLAERIFLERLAYCWDVPILPATFAEGDYIFTGTNGTLISSGTVVVRDDGIEYFTTASVSIVAGTATVNIKCTDAGEDGNCDNGVEMTLLTPISGINDTGTVDTSGITGGVDKESDASLRARILHTIRNPPAGGSAADYKEMALEINGVSNAYVFGNQNVLILEGGHVTIVVLGISPQVPGVTILNAVQAAADLMKPVTATIHVEPITEGDIHLWISIDPNTIEYQLKINESIYNLFNNEGEPGGTILISHLRNAIITSGVTDYEITAITLNLVSQSIDNIVLTDFDYPLLDGITFATL